MPKLVQDDPPDRRSVASERRVAVERDRAVSGPVCVRVTVQVRKGARSVVVLPPHGKRRRRDAVPRKVGACVGQRVDYPPCARVGCVQVDVDCNGLAGARLHGVGRLRVRAVPRVEHVEAAGAVGMGHDNQRAGRGAARGAACNPCQPVRPFVRRERAGALPCDASGRERRVFGGQGVIPVRAHRHPAHADLSRARVEVVGADRAVHVERGAGVVGSRQGGFGKRRAGGRQGVIGPAAVPHAVL